MVRSNTGGVIIPTILSGTQMEAYRDFSHLAGPAMGLGPRVALELRCVLSRRSVCLRCESASRAQVGGLVSMRCKRPPCLSALDSVNGSLYKLIHF